MRHAPWPRKSPLQRRPWTSPGPAAAWWQPDRAAARTGGHAAPETRDPPGGRDETPYPAPIAEDTPSAGPDLDAKPFLAAAELRQLLDRYRAHKP